MSSANALTAFLTSARGRVDEGLERWLPSPPACPAIISEAMRYSLFAGGKRLRPILTLAAADAVARARTASAPDSCAADATGLALPAACALELIHTYSLIHDDLPAMDNDTLRRGRPTLHIVYGEGIAVLAADGLQAEAFALIAREPSESGETDAELLRRKLKVIRVIADAAGPAGMVGGQAIDLQAAGQAPGGRISLDADGLRAMHARKTGALIRASAVSGAVMAGADDSIAALVDRFAADVGLAFQIVDDILDVEGEARHLGKTTGKDAARAKPTYPALFGVERSRALTAEYLGRAHQTLTEARLTDGWLGAIAEWVVTRQN